MTVALWKPPEAAIRVLNVFVPGVPMTKGSWKAFQRGGRARLVPDNDEEPAWAASVGWAVRAKLKNTPPVKARYAVLLEFTLPPPVGRKLYRRDIDKLVRSVLDALTGIVWTDDEQVDEILTLKRRGAEPGVFITIERLP